MGGLFALASAGWRFVGAARHVTETIPRYRRMYANLCRLSYDVIVQGLLFLAACPVAPAQIKRVFLCSAFLLIGMYRVAREHGPTK